MMSSALQVLNLRVMPHKGKPAMVVSATIGTSPIMIYFAQELGEPGDGNAGPGIGNPDHHIRLLGCSQAGEVDKRGCL